MGFRVSWLIQLSVIKICYFRTCQTTSSADTSWYWLANDLVTTCLQICNNLRALTCEVRNIWLNKMSMIEKKFSYEPLPVDFVTQSNILSILSGVCDSYRISNIDFIESCMSMKYSIDVKSWEACISKNSIFCLFSFIPTIFLDCIGKIT